MNKLSSLSYTFWLSLVVALTGCGGGGGGSNPPPAVSSSAPSSVGVSSAPVSLSSSSFSSASSSSVVPLISLSVRGKAGAEALVGGDVVFSVGEKAFSATINDRREYQIEIAVNETLATVPFTGIATGVGNNAWVQLAVAYPSVARLVSLAGTDRVLDANEYLGVNISAMTTAEYLMLQEQDSSISTDTERSYALLGLNTYFEFQRAGFLQVLLNDGDKSAIGAYTTTLAMLADSESIYSRLNVLALRGDLDQQDMFAVLQDPEQMQISTKPITGTFLMQGQWGDTHYWLTLNANGTGHILTSNEPAIGVFDQEGKTREADITWVRDNSSITLTPVTPLNYGKGYVQAIPGCNLNDVFVCDTVISSIRLGLLANNDVGTTASVTVQVDQVNADAEVMQSTSSFVSYMQLQNQQYFYSFTAENLVGAEWYTNNSRFVFNANGTATRTNLAKRVETTINWQLQNGAVTSDGSLLLVGRYPRAGGIAALELLSDRLYPLNTAALVQSLAIKKQFGVSMSAADWTGRWNRITNDTFATSLDFYENGKFRDGFETQVNGSWSVIDAANMRGLSNGEWRFEYELLAIQNGVHYFTYCGGQEATPFNPSGCVLDSYTISKTFIGNLFWETWSKPYFQDSTKAQWRFDGHKLYRGLNAVTYNRIAPNKLYHFENDTVLEMRSSTQNSIEVCEYDADSSCESGTVYQLERGLEIKLNKTGSGELMYSMSGSTSEDATVYGSTLQAKGKQIRLRVEPATGYQMTAENISGCGGRLVNNYYEIPARQTDCEITANFTPNP